MSKQELDKIRACLSDFEQRIQSLNYSEGKKRWGSEVHHQMKRAYTDAKMILYEKFPELKNEILGTSRLYEGLPHRVIELVVDTESPQHSPERYAVYKPLESWRFDNATAVLRPLELALQDYTIQDERSPKQLGTFLLPKGTYEHMKSTPESPKFYDLLEIGFHSETQQRFVVYRPLYKVDLGENTALCRDLDMFQENVTRDGVTKQRFKFVR